MKVNKHIAIPLGILMLQTTLVMGQPATNTVQNKPGFQNSIPASLYPSAEMDDYYHNEWTKKRYRERIVEFKKRPLAQHDVVFIGDSITELAGDWDKRLGHPSIKNRGIAGDCTQGIIDRLDEIIYVKPLAVFMLIGINDLFASHTPDSTVRNILHIIQRIHSQSPATSIYVRTVLPTANSSMIKKIQTINRSLKTKAKAQHFTLIDLHNIFADENDLMKKAYTVDGTHLSEEGYQHWITFEQPLINHLLQSK